MQQAERHYIPHELHSERATPVWVPEQVCLEPEDTKGVAILQNKGQRCPKRSEKHDLLNFFNSRPLMMHIQVI